MLQTLNCNFKWVKFLFLWISVRYKQKQTNKQNNTTTKPTKSDCDLKYYQLKNLVVCSQCADNTLLIIL